MKSKHFHALLSCLLVMVTVIGLFPAMTAQAAQNTDYRDPAEHWMSTGNRTSELDVNANVTYETQYCSTCDKSTTFITYRVPEYTRSGETALNHGVLWSDGTMIDGVSKGNLDAGTPGVNAYYTGYHWTKSICQNCGGGGGTLYNLYDCAAGFMVDISDNHTEQYNSNYHTVTTTKGAYCHFCHGTHKEIKSVQKAHSIHEHIDPQIGNNRFLVCAECSDCGYDADKTLAAKTVVSSYYGNADNKAHTLTLSDLSDSGVNTSIRFGNSASNCTLTSAPNYTDPGFYTVYYKTTYSYGGQSMTENGVAYVQLYEQAATATPTPSGSTTVHAENAHDFHYLDTVSPSCSNLGYENWQCRICGALEKRNYKNALGHDYKSLVIREASCTQTGRTLVMCNKCGDFHEETTPMTTHNYATKVIPATCEAVGYTQHKCNSCGQEYITDITPYASHRYLEHVVPPTCKEKGYTVHTCEVCSDKYVDTYTPEAGHRWDEGQILTSSTCESEGIKVFTCKICGEKMQQAVSANGHRPGAAASCTQPQKCLDCNSILALPTGHSYKTEVVAPSCTKTGYTVYSCEHGDDSYIADYTDKLFHNYKSTVTPATCETMGFSTYTCADCNDSYISNYTEILPHNYTKAVTEPNCLEMGYSVYTCSDCKATYKGDYTNELGHDYKGVVTDPTCQSSGFTTFTCTRDGNSYIGNYTDMLPHNYATETTEPTCENMGYTVYTCRDCVHTETKNYTDPLGHDYKTTVTEPTCLELGFTTFVCKRDGSTYTGDFVSALGHTPSEWIIDAPATLEADGSKHIECTACGAVLSTVILKQLSAEAYTDNDGHAGVGGYVVIVTDKNAAPVPHARVTIDVDSNIGVELPDGRLLDYADQTTVTVLYAELRDNLSRSVPGLTVTVTDNKDNAAMGITNGDGKITVPTSSTSTGDNGNGTIGGEDEDGNNKTYVIIATDKDGKIIDDCTVTIEDGKIKVKLPEGTPFNRDNPVTVTVTDNKGEPQSDLDITLIGDNGVTETGKTNSHGKVTLPETVRGYTNEVGKVKVNGYIVIVENTNGFISRAFVTNTEDNQITVLLPEPLTITNENQVTVTVLLAEDESPVKNMRVTVFDYQNKTATDLTNIHGKITVPPLDKGYTGEDGKVRVDGYIVKVENTTAPIKGAYVTLTADKKITVLLPGTHTLTADNQTTVTVLLAFDETPVKGLNVTVTDANSKTATKITDTNGKILVPDKTTGGGSGGSGGSGGGRGGSGGGGGYTPTPTYGDTHTSYIVGYPGGAFMPENSMTRAEAAAIFARLLAEKNGDIIRSRYSFPDISESEWYAGYVAYLKNYGIIMGYPDGTFGAELTITRAEFTAMSVRFYEAYTGKKPNTSTNGKLLKDVQSSYWAANAIQAAIYNGWIVGYPDGTFRGEADITRAEVVTIVNRVIKRVADKSYIDKNVSILTRFNDVSTRHWAYFDIMEAANTHSTAKNSNPEAWVKR